MSRSERFKTAFDYLKSKGLVQKKKALGDIIGYTRSVVSNAYNGREDYVTDDFIVAFYKSFQDVFNLDWLMNGDGEMLKAPQMAQDARIPYGVESTPPDTLQMLVEQNTRLLDMIAQKDAKIEQLQKELDEMRGVSYPAKKSG